MLRSLKLVACLTMSLSSAAYAGDTQTALSCPSSGIVAFSVTGSNHYSSGGDTLLGYQTTHTNVNAGWVTGGSTFIAPCTGLYSFTVSATKDPYYGGTADDVYVYLRHNGATKGFAWSGEDAYANRNTGTYTVALFLYTGDNVQTFVGSDAGRYRNLALYNFTGFLVKAL